MVKWRHYLVQQSFACVYRQKHRDPTCAQPLDAEQPWAIRRATSILPGMGGRSQGRNEPVAPRVKHIRRESRRETGWVDFTLSSSL
jgi:hypothetical protein